MEGNQDLTNPFYVHLFNYYTIQSCYLSMTYVSPMILIWVLHHTEFDPVRIEVLDLLV